MQRLLKLMLSICLLQTTTFIQAQDISITPATNLTTDATGSAQLFIVFVTTPDCEYCEYVRHEQLEPLQRSGQIQNKALIRELSLVGTDITDFQGNTTTANEFAQRYGAVFAPTVLFLSADGSQLHAPLIGVQSRDFYGYYLDKAIEKSLLKLEDNS